MSDARLRELERAFRESGAVEDEAAYLQEAQRTGRLERRRLGVAADLGHAAARRVHGLKPFAADHVDRVGQSLREHWGPWELTRCSLRLTEALLPTEGLDSGEVLVTRELLAHVQAWLDCPCPEHKRPLPGPWALRNAGLDEETPLGAAALATVLSVTRTPYRGAPATQAAYDAPRQVLEALGFDGYQRAVAERLIPTLLTLE